MLEQPKEIVGPRRIWLPLEEERRRAVVLCNGNVHNGLGRDTLARGIPKGQTPVKKRRWMQ
jgi:hypothetical protein